MVSRNRIRMYDRSVDISIDLSCVGAIDDFEASHRSVASTISTSSIAMARITFPRASQSPLFPETRLDVCRIRGFSDINVAGSRGTKGALVVSSPGLTFARRNSASLVPLLSRAASHPLFTTASPSFSLSFAPPRNFLPNSRDDWLDFASTSIISYLPGFAKVLSRCTSAEGPLCSCSAYLAWSSVLCVQENSFQLWRVFILSFFWNSRCCEYGSTIAWGNRFLQFCRYITRCL